MIVNICMLKLRHIIYPPVLGGRVAYGRVSSQPYLIMLPTHWGVFKDREFQFYFLKNVT